MCEHLGIQPITLRRWCATYAAHLSPTANPTPGTSRRFTGRDLEVLRHVRTLRDKGVSVPLIAEQLAGLTFPTIDHDAPTPPTGHAGIEADSTAIATTTAPDTPQSTQHIIQLLSSQQSQIDAIQRRRLDSVTAIGIGFVAGLLFMVVLLLLASIYGTP